MRTFLISFSHLPLPLPPPLLTSPLLASPLLSPFLFSLLSPFLFSSKKNLGLQYSEGRARGSIRVCVAMTLEEWYVSADLNRRANFNDSAPSRPPTRDW